MARPTTHALPGAPRSPRNLDRSGAGGDAGRAGGLRAFTAICGVDRSPVPGSEHWIRTTQSTPELGPIFANVVLADEINRAPAKVQSALLEVMAERQVSIGGITHPMPLPFMVMATQNPIESEGVYPCPKRSEIAS